MSALTTLVAALQSAGTTAPQVIKLLGGHLSSQSNTQSVVKGLLALATPDNAANTATQIESIAGEAYPSLTPFLSELASAKDQPTINTVTLQIEAAMNANNGVLGGILNGL